MPESPPPQKYSVEAEEKRRGKKKKKKKSPGRRRNKFKLQQAERIEEFPPADIRPANSRQVRERVVWQLEENRAVLVGYRIFSAPGEPEPRLPGFTPRCCYRIEILLVLAFLVYVTGISIDKACEVMRFFCRLPDGRDAGTRDLVCGEPLSHWAAPAPTATRFRLVAQGCVSYPGWAAIAPRRYAEGVAPPDPVEPARAAIGDRGLAEPRCGSGGRFGPRTPG